MKIKSLLFLLVLILAIFSSCRKEESEPDFTKILVGTYHGHFETATVARNNYKVTVTKLASDKVKITPDGSVGTTFETAIKAGQHQSYSGSGVGFSVSFAQYNGIRTLVYEKDEESFTGEK